MEWVILFIISWILFFLLVDLKTLKINIFCGLFAMIMQLMIDYEFTTHKFYVVNNNYICVFGSSLFFVLGPVFVIGILLAQYHPTKKWAIIFHCVFLSTVYTLQEYLLLQTNSLHYLNWDIWSSIRINTMAILSLSWFSIVVLKKGVKKN